MPLGTQAHPSNPASHFTKVLLPLRTIIEGTPTLGSDFAHWTNPMERIKPISKSSLNSQCSKTIYGPGERFIVRARWGGHADRLFGIGEDDRRSGARARADDPSNQTMLDFYMAYVHCIVSIFSFPHEYCRTIHVLDRPGSISILLNKQTGWTKGSVIIDSNDFSTASKDNSAIFEALVDIIKPSKRDKVSSPPHMLVGDENDVYSFRLKQLTFGQSGEAIVLR